MKSLKIYKTMLTMCVMLTFFSCSSRYQMVKAYKYMSGKKQMIRLGNVWMKLYMNSHDRYEHSFDVTCLFKDVTKGKHLKLSRLKIDFIGVGGDTAQISGPIEFIKCGPGIKTLNSDINENELLGPKIFDLTDKLIYSFGYLFTVRNPAQPISNIQIHIQAIIDDDGKIELINKTYPFKKTRYLNIAGN